MRKTRERPKQKSKDWKREGRLLRRVALFRSQTHVSDHLKAEGQKVIITGRDERGELEQDLGYKNVTSRIQREGIRTEGKG